MRRAIVLSVVVLMLVGLVVSPVGANPDDKPVGERINVAFGEPATFEADKQFFVAHGWLFGPSDWDEILPPGRFGSRLEVDGVDQGRGTLLNYGVGVDKSIPGVEEDGLRQHLYNFEDGLSAGDHILTGHWFAPCSAALELYGYSGPCRTPNESVKVWTVEHRLTFTE